MQIMRVKVSVLLQMVRVKVSVLLQMVRVKVSVLLSLTWQPLMMWCMKSRKVNLV